MKIVQGQNVRECYKIGMELLREVGVPESSRAGNVIVAPFPVTTVYERPQERVLLNAARNANPFFHFFEGLWMLSGSDDGTFLNEYVSDFTERFADYGSALHGAYGFRWRRWFSFDQIRSAYAELSGNPSTRRVVIAIWDPREDLDRPDLKDIPCNTHLYFRINEGRLDMMVNCRSNDIIWGAYGANAVHMSILQEYLASLLTIDVGRMYQNSWNFHAYENLFNNLIDTVADSTWCSPYEENTYPLCNAPLLFEQECRMFFKNSSYRYSNTLFIDVAFPMRNAHKSYKNKDYETALEHCAAIMAPDWRRACTEWIQRRIDVLETRRDAGEINYEGAK